MDFRFYIRHKVGCVLSQKECEMQSVPAVHWLSSHQQQTVELLRDQQGCHLIQQLCFPVYHPQQKMSINLKCQQINTKHDCQVQIMIANVVDYEI